MRLISEWVSNRERFKDHLPPTLPGTESIWHIWHVHSNVKSFYFYFYFVHLKILKRNVVFWWKQKPNDDDDDDEYFEFIFRIINAGMYLTRRLVWLCELIVILFHFIFFCYWMTHDIVLDCFCFHPFGDINVIWPLPFIPLRSLALEISPPIIQTIIQNNIQIW